MNEHNIEDMWEHIKTDMLEVTKKVVGSKRVEVMNRKEEKNKQLQRKIGGKIKHAKQECFRQRCGTEERKGNSNTPKQTPPISTKTKRILTDPEEHKQAWKII